MSDVSREDEADLSTLGGGKRLLYQTMERARGRLLEVEQSKLLLRRVESSKEIMIARRTGKESCN